MTPALTEDKVLTQQRPQESDRSLHPRMRSMIYAKACI